MTAWQIYLLTRCEGLRSAAFGAMVVAGAIAIVFLFCIPILFDGWMIESEELRASIRRQMRLWTIGLVGVATPIMVLVPTKTDIAIIIAGAWATNNADMRAMPDKAMQVVNKFLDDYLKGGEVAKP